MAKRRKSPRRGRPDSGKTAAAKTPPARNAFLDSLRGLAIVLMVVDHVAGLWFDVSIQDSHLRTATRLSMPLFCLLMGYFLDPDKFRGGRLAQIAVACGLANAVFWPHYGSIEILGSLLVAYLISLAAGRFFPWFVLTILLYPVDPLRGWFDFPLTLVISFVALGMVVRRFGSWPAIGMGALTSAYGFAIVWGEPSGVNHKLCLFLLPATLLILAGRRWPERGIWGLEWVGRWPLTIYLIQYYLVFAVASLLTGRN
jgi:uncharacterized membrane protein YcfT